jgi:hypothetical protein
MARLHSQHCIDDYSVTNRSRRQRSTLKIPVPVICARNHHSAAVILVWSIGHHVHWASHWRSPQKLIHTHIPRQKFWSIIL